MSPSAASYAYQQNRHSSPLCSNAGLLAGRPEPLSSGSFSLGSCEGVIFVIYVRVASP
jgi:hypothetical protein